MSSSSKILADGFDRMLAHFGPRSWWPGETPFEVIVGAILTQNTNWKNVERAIANIRAERAMCPHALLKMNPSHLAELIRPAGYFRIKTSRLKNFLKYFVETYDGDVDRMSACSTEDLRCELLSVNGIGPETADSILLYAIKKPVFVIDTYTKRIFSRHALCSEEDGYHELQEFFMDRLPEDISLFNEYHALIVETAKEYCRKVPRCGECPLCEWNGGLSHPGLTIAIV